LPQAFRPTIEEFMRVNDRIQTGSVTGSTPLSRGSSASGKFTLGNAGATEKSQSTGAAGAVGGMDGLLAVQAAGDAVERRRRAMRRGRNLLDSLDQLKISILSGRISPQQLETLKAQLRQRSEGVDEPGLADVLAHIELRAEVELAKLARGG
jgi:hypothetical protein